VAGIRSYYMKKMFLVALILCVIATAVLAFSFGIDSPSIHLKTSPGSTVEQELVVYSESTDRMTVKVSVEDWKYRENRTKQFLKKGAGPYSCSDWITPEQDKFVLAPGEKRKFRFKMKTPAGVSGGHQAVVFFEGIPSGNNASGKSGVLFTGKIGAIIYQHTEGKTSVKGEVDNVIAAKQNGQAIVSLQFKNTGNDWIQAKGNAVLVDTKGKTVARGEFDPVKTLPGESVPASVLVKSFTALNTGTYKVIVTIDTGTEVLVKDASITI
jgi:hypothetical protein